MAFTTFLHFKKVKAQYIFKGTVSLIKKVVGSLKVNVCRWRCKMLFKGLLERRTIFNKFELYVKRQNKKRCSSIKLVQEVGTNFFKQHDSKLHFRNCFKKCVFDTSYKKNDSFITFLPLSKKD